MTRAPAYSSAAANWLEHAAAASLEREHALNLRGKTRETCSACNGTGHSEPSRTDCDSHGSYYVPAVDCRRCGGDRRVEVACSPELELEAVQREIDKLRARTRELKRKLARKAKT